MKNVTQLRNLKKGYCKVPSKIYQIGLEHQSIALYGYLAYHAEEYSPSERQISKDLKMDRKTVRKYLKVMVDRGIIKRLYGPVGSLKKYAFTSPNSWR